MQYEVEGQLAQVARITFDAGDICWGSKGSLVCLPPDLPWKLKVPGGLEGAARRVMSGESIALMHFEGTRDGDQVVMSANQSGKIIDWELERDGPVVTTRGSFVAAFGPEIKIDVSVAKRVGAAFFGGAGLFLQKISGRGTVLIHGAGDFMDRSLQKGESLLVSTGNLAAFADEVDYNIQTVGGVRRVLFGGEGLFMTRLAGPGRVLLQSLKRGVSAAANG
jgi:uncharacterized protein (TIGR00266 family)